MTISQSELPDKFCAYLHIEKNASPLTVTNYRKDIKSFADFCSSVLTETSNGSRLVLWI